MDILELLKDLDVNTNTITDAFSRMDVAEEEIQRAQQVYPDQSDRLWCAFHLLCPPSILNGRPVEMYQAYCRELLERIATEEDTTLGTNAECLIALSEASLRSPMTQTAKALYFDLFKAVFGEDVIDKLDIAKGAQYMVAQPVFKEELLQDIRKKIRVPDRKYDEDRLTAYQESRKAA